MKWFIVIPSSHRQTDYKLTLDRTKEEKKAIRLPPNYCKTLSVNDPFGVSLAGRLGRRGMGNIGVFLVRIALWGASTYVSRFGGKMGNVQNLGSKPTPVKFSDRRFVSAGSPVSDL